MAKIDEGRLSALGHPPQIGIESVFIAIQRDDVDPCVRSQAAVYAPGRSKAVPKMAIHAMQVKRILDRRALYEGRYKYRDVEADGQHPAIIN